MPINVFFKDGVAGTEVTREKSISEHFFKMMTLEDYINKNSDLINEKFIMCILWQIVHTLAIIRQKYKNFNNNLLNIVSTNIYVTDNNKHNTKYEYNGKEKYYHPDFFIEELNLIVEIKSDYYYDLYLEKNIRKKKSCIEQGYDFIFIINKIIFIHI